MNRCLLLIICSFLFWCSDKNSINNEKSSVKKQIENIRIESQQLDFIKSKNNSVISWKDASYYIGEYKTVEGVIVSTYNSGRACFLNFHPNYRLYFTAVIFASAFRRFPPNPQKYYYGKKVRVTGVIKEYRGKPEIIVNYPEQIEIIE